jgi:hypothetical protein
MATIEDLELAKAKVGVVVTPEEEYPDLEEALACEDMSESLSILIQTMHLLDYVADPDLCKRISKRERDNMAWLAEKIRVFVDEKAGYYLEGSE